MRVPTRITQFPFLIFEFCYEKRSHTRSRYIPRKRQRLLSCEIESKINLCTKVCRNMIPLYQTPSNLPTFEDHPEEKRGEHGKILIEILTNILMTVITIM